MWSGVIVAFYVIPHVINHAFGLISYDVMEGMRLGMKVIWGPPIGELVLLLAFLTHFLYPCLRCIAEAHSKCRSGKPSKSDSVYSSFQ